MYIDNNTKISDIAETLPEKTKEFCFKLHEYKIPVLPLAIGIIILSILFKERK